MQSHGAFEILARHVLKRTNFDNAGVVDQNVDLAEAIDDLTNSCLDLATIEQIALNGQDHAAALDEIGLCTRQFIRVARDERDAPALRANVSRKHESKSARSTRDKCNLAA